MERFSENLILWSWEHLSVVTQTNAPVTESCGAFSVRSIVSFEKDHLALQHLWVLPALTLGDSASVSLTSASKGKKRCNQWSRCSLQSLKPLITRVFLLPRLSWASDDWFLPETAALVTSLSPLSRCSIHVACPSAESLRRELMVPTPPGSLRPLQFRRLVLCPQPILSHLLVMKLCDFPARFFSSHSRPSNLSLCFYLALLFILNLRGFIICGLLWDISFIVDQVCKLQGSRIEGPRAVPTFLARMYLPWKGLLWGWSS